MLSVDFDTESQQDPRKDFIGNSFRNMDLQLEREQSSSKIQKDDQEYTFRRDNSICNSINDLQNLKYQSDSSYQQSDKSSMLKTTQKKVSYCTELYNKKLDNMIDYITVQLQKEIKTQIQPEETYSEYLNNHLDSVLKIQSYIRMKLCKRSYKTKLNRIIYRENVIRELYDTEERYVDDLKMLITKVLQPIRNQNILSEDQIRKIFNNIEAIYILNQDFVRELKSYYTKINNKLVRMDKYWHYQIIGDKAMKFAHFFKIYYDFFQNFSIENIEFFRNDPDLQFDEFITELEKQNIFRGLNLESFLVKPVQRLPKYVLLFKDLVKHTDADHPDYYNLVKALDEFRNVNTNINQKINKQVKNLKMFELQRTFGDQENISILEATREFIAEETLSIIHNDHERSVIVYFMTDLLLISERAAEGREKLFRMIEIGENSKCKDSPDFSYYKHLFTVIGKYRNITFTCGSKLNKKKIIQLIENMIYDTHQKKQMKRQQNTEIPQQIVQPVTVETIATEDRDGLFQTYTIYVIEISMQSYKFRIYVRYSEMVQLESKVKEYFPTFELPHLETINLNWIKTKRTKIIEGRKLLIEDFLRTILQSDQIRNDPYRWLNLLDLPDHFYLLGDVQEEQLQKSQDITGQFMAALSNSRGSLDLQFLPSSFQSTLQRGDKLPPNYFQENFQTYASSEVLRMTKGETSNRYSAGNSQRMLSSRQNSIMQGARFNIPITTNKIPILLMDGTSVTLEIDQSTRSLQLVEMVAKNINLQTYLDFKLVITDCYYRTIRVIDDDEIMMKIYKSINKNEKGGIDYIINKIADFFTSKEKNSTYVVLKKYIYLSNQQEEVDFKNDAVRLKLITHQVFNQIRSGKYNLEMNEYYLHAAFYLHIRYYDTQLNVLLNVILQLKLHSKANFPEHIFQEIVPTKIFNQHPIKVWIDNVFITLKRVRADIRDIRKEKAKILTSQFEMKQINQKAIDQLEQNYLAQIIFLKQISLNIFYGVTFYQVQTDRQTKTQLKTKFKIDIPIDVKLGISLKELIITQIFISQHLNRNLQQHVVIHSFKFEKIEGIQYFPNSIVFTTKLRKQLTRLTFSSEYIFEMHKLLQEYQQIRTLQEQFSCSQFEENENQIKPISINQ